MNKNSFLTSIGLTKTIEFNEFIWANITHYAHSKGTLFESNYKGGFEDIVRNIHKQINDSASSSINLSKPLKDLILDEVKTKINFKPTAKHKFTFIDLFAGIGGFRIAMQNLGGRCVFTSEWDKQAKVTYEHNYGEYPFGDITSERTKSYIPDGFDVLCAGFPCQAFSIAGKRGGFEDTRGTLFFDVAEIIRRKKPKAVFLENVQ